MNDITPPSTSNEIPQSPTTDTLKTELSNDLKAPKPTQSKDNTLDSEEAKGLENEVEKPPKDYKGPSVPHHQKLTHSSLDGSIEPEKVKYTPPTKEDLQEVINKAHESLITSDGSQNSEIPILKSPFDTDKPEDLITANLKHKAGNRTIMTTTRHVIPQEKDPQEPKSPKQKVRSNEVEKGQKKPSPPKSTLSKLWGRIGLFVATLFVTQSATSCAPTTPQTVPTTMPPAGTPATTAPVPGENAPIVEKPLAVEEVVPITNEETQVYDNTLESSNPTFEYDPEVNVVDDIREAIGLPRGLNIQNPTYVPSPFPDVPQNVGMRGLKDKGKIFTQEFNDFFDNHQLNNLPQGYRYLIALGVLPIEGSDQFHNFNDDLPGSCHVLATVMAKAMGVPENEYPYEQIGINMNPAGLARFLTERSESGDSNWSRMNTDNLKSIEDIDVLMNDMGKNAENGAELFILVLQNKDDPEATHTEVFAPVPAYLENGISINGVRVVKPYGNPKNEQDLTLIGTQSSWNIAVTDPKIDLTFYALHQNNKLYLFGYNPNNQKPQ